MKNIFLKHLTGFMAAGLTALCFISCKSPVETNEKFINEAEKLMWKKPDSALTILNMADTVLLDKNHKAVYKLLYTQALDKTDGDITHRSEVFGLKDYFERTGNLNYAALAAFYEGRIFQERRNNEHALIAFLSATAYENHINDHRLKGLIRLNMGILNYREPNYTEALLNLQKAYNFFLLAEEPMYQVYSLLLTGKSFILNGNAEKSLQSYEKALDICKENKIEHLQYEIIQDMGVIFLSSGDYQKANDLFFQARTLFSSEKNWMTTTLNLAKLYVNTGEIDSARHYAQQAVKLFEKVRNPHATVNAYYILSSIEEKDGNFEQALLYHKQYADSLFKIKDEENELKMFQIREEHQTDLYRKKNEILAYFFWIVGLVAGLIIITLVFLLYWRSVHLNEKVRKAMEDLKKMADNYNDKEVTIKNLVLQHFDIMRKVFILQNTEKKQGINPDLLKKFNQLIYNTDEMDWNTLYQRINDLCDNRMIRMKQVFELCLLTDEDFRIFCLDYAGFLQQEASIILNISVSKIQKRMATIRVAFGANRKDNIFELVRQKASETTKLIQIQTFENRKISRVNP